MRQSGAPRFLSALSAIFSLHKREIASDYNTSWANSAPEVYSRVDLFFIRLIELASIYLLRSNQTALKLQEI